MTDNEIIKGLYYLWCAAEYKDSVTMSKELAIGLYDYFNRQNAEIERLKATVDSFTDIGKLYSEIKAEAIKEFAERLKEELTTGRGAMRMSTLGIIDNLVKEMVGDTDG